MTWKKKIIFFLISCLWWFSSNTLQPWPTEPPCLSWKLNQLDSHMQLSNSNLSQPPERLGANAFPSLAVINVYLFKHTLHKMLTLCHLTYLFTDVANKYSGRLVHAEWLKWSLNFLMRMWYNDLFSSVRLHKYQLCIGSTPLCPFVVPVWKCVLLSRRKHDILSSLRLKPHWHKYHLFWPDKLRIYFWKS